MFLKRTSVCTHHHAMLGYILTTPTPSTPLHAPYHSKSQVGGVDWFLVDGFCRCQGQYAAAKTWSLWLLPRQERILQRDCHTILFYGQISPPSAMICHLLVTGADSSQPLPVGDCGRFAELKETMAGAACLPCITLSERVWMECIWLLFPLIAPLAPDQFSLGFPFRAYAEKEFVSTVMSVSPWHTMNVELLSCYMLHLFLHSNPPLWSEYW